MRLLGRAWSDADLERIIAAVLRAGVGAAAAVVLAGGIHYLARYGAAPVDYHVFRAEPAQLRSLAGIVAAAGSLRSRGIIQIGLLLLILTPIARVVFSAAAFAVQRDRFYVVVTLIVLAVLLYNLSGGYH